jgi:TolB protein
MLSLIATTTATATFPGNNGRIAFSQGDVFPGAPEFGHSQVFTIGANGAGLARLTNVANNRNASAPAWSADGQRIAYNSNQSGSFAIWRMDANGDHHQQLTHESGFEDFLPSWSPNGKRILFSHCGEPFGLVAYCDLDTMNANGGGLKTVLGAGHWTNINASYSPSGNRIVFESDRGGLQSAIWVVGADGSKPHRVTPAKLGAYYPDWAPNGKRIAFTVHCCTGAPSNIWTVRPDGGGLRKLTHFRSPLQGAFPTYSPDGKRIVFSHNSRCRRDPTRCKDFYVMHADGSHVHRVSTGVGRTFLPVWGSR